MLKIKLQRTGRRNQPYYRVVIAEAKSKLSGRYIDLLGTYNPHLETNNFNIDQKKYNAWLKKGAQPTDTVRKLANKS